jgi:pentachlorophenol monooxygenase/3-(3-hydroxy-phenyl)propionate hydroxylase
VGALDRRIRQIVGDRPYEIVWASVYRFHSRLTDRMRVGRVLVAGDCAHLMAPFGARGLNSGVQDAENAAWKIAFVLRGWAPPDLLDSYQAERRAAAAENLAVTTRTMNFLVPPTASARRHRRDVLDRAAADPRARAEVDSGRLAEPLWYVDSPLTTPHPELPFTGRPDRGATPPPVPGVLVPDVPVRPPGEPHRTRLRELVRDGLLVLTTGDPGAARSALAGATSAPSRALAVADLDPTGLLGEVLNRPSGDAWLIRPDGHLAAVVPAADPTAIRAAVRRALGDPSTGI